MNPENVGILNSTCITYTKGYKYQLEETLYFWTNIRPKEKIVTDFIILDTDGLLTIIKGYAWDGASGPTIDSPSTIFGSCVHDALYQLMRMGLILQSCRSLADIYLWVLITRDGMNKFRAWLWHREVKKWAAKAASPKNRKVVHTAP